MLLTSHDVRPLVIPHRVTRIYPDFVIRLERVTRSVLVSKMDCDRTVERLILPVGNFQSEHVVRILLCIIQRQETDKVCHDKFRFSLAGKVADIFSDKRAAVAGNGNKTVKRVAVVNGGGGDISFLTLAASCNADCYVTGDVPHHVALYADQSGLPIIILQHYAAERIYIKRLGEILSGLARNNNTDVQFEISEYERNPIRMEEV